MKPHTSVQPRSTDLARRRRAVHTALLPFLPPEALYRALWQWEDGYSGGPSMALHGFVNALCRDPGLSALRRDIHRSLVDALARPETELAADPLPEMQAVRAGRAPRSQHSGNGDVYEAFDPMRARVFEQLMKEFFTLLREHDRDSIEAVRKGIAETLAGLGLPPRDFGELSQWIYLQRPLQSSAPLYALRRLVHAAYVGACATVGPVTTDELLAAAARRCESIPEAARFPPRRLL